jgi:hypothetical protein
VGWTKTKDTNVVGFLEALTRLQRVLVELRAHHQLVRLGLQVRMQAVDNDRTRKRQELWAGKAGISKTRLQSKQ